MKDDRTRQIADLLRELPREHARPGFTARLLEKLEEDRPAPWWASRLSLVSAVTALAALVVSAGVLTDWRLSPRKSVDTAEARQILEEIRAEHGRLERELREISEPPVVYLGGDEQVDLVLDLGNVGGSEVAPAAYQNTQY